MARYRGLLGRVAERIGTVARSTSEAASASPRSPSRFDLDAVNQTKGTPSPTIRTTRCGWSPASRMPWGALARVTQIKTKGDVTYVGVDAGMNSLIRPALYGHTTPSSTSVGMTIRDLTIVNPRGPGTYSATPVSCPHAPRAMSSSSAHGRLWLRHVEQLQPTATADELILPD